MDIFFSYRIEAGAEMGIDYETGKPCETYSQIRFGEVKEGVTQDELNKHHKELVIAVANTFGIDAKYVIPISNEEYDRECNDDDYDETEVLKVTKD